MILHITTRDDWSAAVEAGLYQADSMEAEGFIHCSTPSQIVATANRFYQGRQGLVVLCIDADRVSAEVRFEAPVPPGPDGLFPHVYGPLNLDAVVAVVPFPPGPDGAFTTPPLPVE